MSCGKTDVSYEREEFGEAFIYDIPLEILLPYLLVAFASEEYNSNGSIKSAKTHLCTNSHKNYLVSLSRCIQVSKDWRNYFKEPIFWRPVYTWITVSTFYEKKKKLLMSEKHKALKSKDWTKEEVRQNKCKMVILNETKDIPFDIFWIVEGKKPSCVIMGTVKKQYHCGTTYPNARWMCIPTKEWLNENKYSTVGFSWAIDIFNLKSFTKENGETVLAYVVTIREPDLLKMHPIKNINKRIENYQKKIIQMVYNPDALQSSWEEERKKRKQDRIILEETRKKAKKIRNGIQQSEKKSSEIMYILNMFD